VAATAAALAVPLPFPWPSPCFGGTRSSGAEAAGRDVGDLLLGLSRLGGGGRHRHHGHVEAEQDAGTRRQGRQPRGHHLSRFTHHVLAALAAPGPPYPRHSRRR